MGKGTKHIQDNSMTQTPNPDTHSILVVGPAWVGDMVMAQSLFITLAQHHPKLRLDVLAPPWSLPLLACMPEVQRGIALPVKHRELALVKRWRLGRRLRAEQYKQAIVLPRSFKSALPPWVAGIPQRTGYRGEIRYGLLNDIRPLDRQRLYRTVDRFVNLGLQAAQPAVPLTVPEPKLHLDPEAWAQTLVTFGLNPAQGPMVALCPGAEYGSAKRWPNDYFAAIARHYLARDYQVLLLGSERDRSVTATITQLAAGCRDLAGQTSLIQAAHLLAATQWVLSNDSGLMHIAAAVGARVIALYGSSDPTFTPPLSAGATVLHQGLACSPCFRRECPLGHLNCLRQLDVSTVLNAIETHAFSPLHLEGEGQGEGEIDEDSGSGSQRTH